MSQTNTNILIVKDLLFLSICFVDVIVFSVFFTQFGLSVIKLWKCAWEQVSSLVKLMDIYKIQIKNQMPHGKTNNSVNKMFHYLEPYIITGKIAFFSQAYFWPCKKF